MNQPNINIRCPWIGDHSSDSGPSETTYFPAGTGGFTQGHFRCLHASHAEKTDADFLAAIGYTDHQMLEGFEDLSLPTDTQTPVGFTHEGALTTAGTPSPVDGPRFLRHPSTGMIKVLVKNVVEALRHPAWCGLLVRYDTFRSVVMVGEPGACRPIRDTDGTALNIRLAEQGFGPGAVSHDMIERAISFASHEREFDSAVEWLTGLPPWDGVPRVELFCTTYLGVEDTPYHRAVSRYWWTAHAGRALHPEGIQADAAVILVSAQGTGKTQLVKVIAPWREAYGAINLSGDHYNRIRELRGRLVVELAELQGLKSRDAESIKAIISAMGDTLVEKYEKHAQDLARRCVFIGSSNNDDFLSDSTGNRRFLPIYVGEKQDTEGVARDRDQLWAEAAVQFRTLGEVDWRRAQDLVRVEHCKFEEIDAWEETIVRWLDDPTNWSASLRNEPCDPFVTCATVLREALHMDTQHQSARDMHRAARIFVRFGLKKKNVREAGHQTKIWVRHEINLL